ncbi:MAG: MerR family transcriptional regulator [Pseudomonadota bacterium]|nr:MerR family transcriptional regulator [Pseudomonadota bacterium]
MKQYRIGAVAKLTGLSVHNLRVWEKRHSAVQTERTESGRRVYSEAALNRLKLLKACVDHGLAISSVAGMSDEELRETLTEFGRTEPKPVARRPAIKVCLVGSEVLPTMEQTIRQYLNNSDLERHQDLGEFEAQYEGECYDLVMLDVPSFSAAEAQQLGAFIKTLAAQQVVVFYRFARQQDVTYLRTLGVRTMKAPVDRIDLHSMLSELANPEQKSARILPMRRPPSRQFSDQALNKAASMSSSIDCECPHHMAELIKSLVAFEKYSAQCQNKDKAGEDLHRHIHVRTAEAREIMETLLQSILEQEGIDLNLVEA